MLELRVIPVRGMGDIKPGDVLVDKMLGALRRQRVRLIAGDILVVTHKIVSKAAGRVVPLEQVKASRRARRWAARHGLRAQVVELALSESRRVVRQGRGVLITETRHGFVCANSGVDLSNVDGGRSAALLPLDPDRAAAKLNRAIKRKLGLFIPIIISDSFGRPWRRGLTEVAIGVAGMRALKDFRGKRDPYGYRLKRNFGGGGGRIGLRSGSDEREVFGRACMCCPGVLLSARQGTRQGFDPAPLRGLVSLRRELWDLL